MIYVPKKTEKPLNRPVKGHLGKSYETVQTTKFRGIEVMEQERNKKKKQRGGYCYYRGRSYQREPNLWKPGEPLTAKDQAMLSVLVRKYNQLGYVPSQKEVPNARAIKKRFRIWADAVAAAGLPIHCTPGQSRIRMKKREWEKRMQDLLS